MASQIHSFIHSFFHSFFLSFSFFFPLVFSCQANSDDDDDEVGDLLQSGIPGRHAIRDPFLPRNGGTLINSYGSYGSVSSTPGKSY